MKLRCYRHTRRGRLVRCVVISGNGRRCVRHDRVVDVVQGVQVLERKAVEVDRQLVLTRDCGGAEVTTKVETLEGWRVEAGVAVLDHAVFILHPYEQVVRVQDVLADLALLVVTEAQGVFTLVIGLAVDGLENVLGVRLKHFLGCLGDLVRIILVRLTQLLVRCRTVLGQGGCVHGVAISRLINAVKRRTGCHDALIGATGLQPHATGNGVRDLGLRRR